MLRFAEHEVVLPVVVVTELWRPSATTPSSGYFAGTALRMLDDLRIKEGRLDAPVAGGEDGGTLRVELNHTDPSSLPAGFQLGDNDTRILSVAKPGQRGPRRHHRQQGPAHAGQGLGGRPGGRGVPARAGRRLRLDRHGRARRDGGGDGPPLRQRPGRARRGRRDAVPHRPRAALPAGSGPGSGGRRQAGPAGPWRPRRLRPARPQRRAADRPRPPARPRRRHRQPRRPRRHRQVGAGAVRRPRGGHGAPPAAQGRRLPAAVRRRRPGARLPARREAEKMGPGRRRSSTPWGPWSPTRWSRRSWTAACSRSCR